MTVLAQHGFKVPDGLDAGASATEALHLMRAVLTSMVATNPEQVDLTRLNRDDLQRLAGCVTRVASGQPATAAEVGTLYALTLKASFTPGVLQAVRVRNNSEADHLHCHSLDLGADLVDNAMRSAMAALSVIPAAGADLDESQQDLQLEATLFARNTFLGGQEAPAYGVSPRP